MNNNTHAAMTYIGAETVFDGEMNLLDSALVAGVLKGKITSGGHVNIEPSGIIDGELHCIELRVSGMFKGNLTCERLLIDKQGVVEGEVASQQMQIVNGGQFIGRRRQGADTQNLLADTAEKVLITEPSESNLSSVSSADVKLKPTLGEAEQVSSKIDEALPSTKKDMDLDKEKDLDDEQAVAADVKHDGPKLKSATVKSKLLGASALIVGGIVALSFVSSPSSPPVSDKPSSKLASVDADKAFNQVKPVAKEALNSALSEGQVSSVAIDVKEPEKIKQTSESLQLSTAEFKKKMTEEAPVTIELINTDVMATAAGNSVDKIETGAQAKKPVPQSSNASQVAADIDSKLEHDTTARAAKVADIKFAKEKLVSKEVAQPVAQKPENTLETIKSEADTAASDAAQGDMSL